jgi:putative PIN family toxin of toxin-antitoxin system
VIRALLDTKTIVSGIIVPVGIPARILAAARAGTFEMVSGPALVTEALRTLNQDRIRNKYRLTPAQVEGVRILLEEKATLTVVSRQVQGVARHPEDDLILATALSGAADYLVTGDAQLLKLQEHEGVRIVRRVLVHS